MLHVFAFIGIFLLLFAAVALMHDDWKMAIVPFILGLIMAVPSLILLKS